MKDLWFWFLDNHISVMFALTIALIIYRSIYMLYFAIREVPDDWFERMSYIELSRKYGKRHKEFVGQPIELSKDISMIYSDGEGNYERVFKE